MRLVSRDRSYLSIGKETTRRYRDEFSYRGEEKFKRQSATILPLRTYSRIYLIQELRVANLNVFRRNTWICHMTKNYCVRYINGRMHLSLFFPCLLQMANQCVKKCSLLFLQDMYIYNILRSTFTEIYIKSINEHKHESTKLLADYSSISPFYRSSILHFSRVSFMYLRGVSSIHQGPTSTTTLHDGVPTKFLRIRGCVEKSMARKAGEHTGAKRISAVSRQERR